MLMAQEPCDLVLHGTVLDEHDNTPLSFAEIYLPALERGTVADTEGRFRLEGVCAGTYAVRVTHLGCEPVVREVGFSSSREITFYLEHHHEELRQLEVVRRRPDEQVGMGKSVLGREDIQSMAGRSLTETLKDVPGLEILSTGPTISKPVIHGLSGNRILTLNQGIRQEDQQWGTEHAPSLDPLSSDRITVVKGAATVQYGADAMGGVIITEPVKLPTKPGTTGELGLLGRWNGRGGGASGMVQGGFAPVRGLGWRVQGSARLQGDAQSPEHVLSNTGLHEYGTSAAVGLSRHRYDLSAYYSYFRRKLGILRAAHIGNLTDLENALENGALSYEEPFTYNIEAPWQQVQHHLMRLSATLRTSEFNQLVATYAYQANDRQEYDIRRNSGNSNPSIDLFLYTHQADLVFKHFLGKKIHGKVGLTGRFQENENIPGTGVRPLVPDYSQWSLGGFVLEHFQLGKRLELEAGVRFEHANLDVRRFDDDDNYLTPTHKFNNFAFSIGGNYSLKDSMQFRANISSGFRAPQVSELYSDGLHHGSAAIEEGDPNLGTEQIAKFVLDYDAWWGKGRINTLITAHAAKIEDYILLVPNGQRLTIQGAFPVFQYTSTNASLTGLDLTIGIALTKTLQLRSTFSMVRGRDLKADTWLFRMPSDRLKFGLAFKPKSKGKWMALRLELNSTTAFYQSRYPKDLDFAPPPDGYHLLGFQIGIERPFDKGTLTLGLESSNLLNTKYRDYLDNFRYYANAPGFDLVMRVGYRFNKNNSKQTNEH